MRKLQFHSVNGLLIWQLFVEVGFHHHIVRCLLYFEQLIVYCLFRSIYSVLISSGSNVWFIFLNFFLGFSLGLLRAFHSRFRGADLIVVTASQRCVILWAESRKLFLQILYRIFIILGFVFSLFIGRLIIRQLGKIVLRKLDIVLLIGNAEVFLAVVHTCLQQSLVIIELKILKLLLLGFQSFLCLVKLGAFLILKGKESSALFDLVAYLYVNACNRSCLAYFYIVALACLYSTASAYLLWKRSASDVLSRDLGKRVIHYRVGEKCQQQHYRQKNDYGVFDPFAPFSIVFHFKDPFLEIRD